VRRQELKQNVGDRCSLLEGLNYHYMKSLAQQPHFSIAFLVIGKESNDLLRSESVKVLGELCTLEPGGSTRPSAVCRALIPYIWNTVIFKMMGGSLWVLGCTLAAGDKIQLMSTLRNFSVNID